MNTQTRTAPGIWPAVQAPKMHGQWLARLPLVVGATVGLVTLVVTTLGILHGAA
jgi:hypothetical protein